MRTRIVSAALVSAALIAGPRAAAAQGYFEVGGFGSYARFDPTLPWQSASSGGARMSFGSGSGLGTFVLEGEGSYFSLPTSGTTTQYIPSRARLLFTPTVGPLAIMMGGGAVRTDYIVKEPVSTHASGYGYTALAGFRLAMGNYLAFRAEGVLDYLTHPVNANTGVRRNSNRSVQAGLSIPLWSRRPAPRDESSLRDDEKAPAPVAKPATPAPVYAAVDKPEPKSDASLPDADRDGVPDVRDACSGTAAGSTVDAAGCAVYRDSDNDGVIDARDACPGTPSTETVDGRGCITGRDNDDDGVPDSRDRCQGTPAGMPVNSIGCPIEAPKAAPAAPAPAPVAAAPVEMFKGPARTVTLRGVNFAPWKDELTPGSLAVLDDVARQLIESPTVKVEIAGHTDNRGAYTRNLRLSLERAQAVRAYLIMRGVDENRLVARGYGMAKPITENATPAGRAMNRRVELKRLD
jgi:outer membrane protein OmpA-like peptidoglycan-associated protein